MKKIKRASTVILLALVTVTSSGCAISLFSSEHKHYHHDKCKKQCKDTCSHESNIKSIEVK